VKHKLTEKFIGDVNAYLAEKGVTLRSGTLVDATEASGMRRRPPKIDQLAAQAEQTARQSLDMPPGWHQK